MTSDMRCQKQLCKEKIVQLADERRDHAETVRELRRVRANVREEVEGAIRRWDAEQGVLLRAELSEANQLLADTRRDRTWAVGSARKLADNLADVMLEKAGLARQVGELTKLVAAAKKTAEQVSVAHRYEMRAAARSMRDSHSAAAAATSLEADERAQAISTAADARAHLCAEETEAAAAVAGRAAIVAKQEALELSADLAEAKTRLGDTAWLLFLAEKRETRAKAKNVELEAKVSEVAPSGRDMTADDWAALSRSARDTAHHRARRRIDSILCGHTYCPEDLATVLHQHNLLDKLFDTHAGFDIYFNRVRALMTTLENEHYGTSFALYLRFELRLTMPKIFEVTKAACKEYNRDADRFKAKIILFHRHRKGVAVKVPRLAPPPSKLTPIIKSVEEKLGCEHSEDGSIAFRSVATIFQDLMAHDPGKHDMPALPFYLGGAHPVPIVIQWDATGYGKLQLTTAALRNPYLPMSAQQLRLLGIGNCGDDKKGTAMLMGPNVAVVNEWIISETCQEVMIDGTPEAIKPGVYISTDVSALRHTEHLANSGWCGCARDFALRTVPKKPTSYAEMYAMLLQCKSVTGLERFDLAHQPRPGMKVPLKCPACTFGHATDDSITMRLYAEMMETEKTLRAVDTKAGKVAFSKWRMAHAASHFNVQPGEYGRPLLHYDMDDFILDMLHLAELGVPKTPWKHGILNNASDDARDKISAKLEEWKHPLDCRRKDDNRSRAQKWFTGEAWASFCIGQRGSPGGPQAIAELVMIIAEDMQTRGVTIGSGTSAEVATVGAAAVKLKGKAAAAARNTSAVPETPASGADSAVPQLKHVPTALELAADPDDLKIIREIFGSRAQTLINTLLSFDGYFNWYYPLKDHGLDVLDSNRDRVIARAFGNCRSAIDLQEICERLSIRNHKSFLFHGAVYKVTRDILKVGNVWAFGTTSLELANADTKRVADQAASRRTKFCEYTQTRVPLAPGFQGPMRLTETSKRGTTMAISTMNFLLVRGVLRRGDGLVSTPASRRAERLFGVGGPGRSRQPSAGCKIETLNGPAYDARSDTCIKAFVRLMAAYVSGL